MGPAEGKTASGQHVSARESADRLLSREGFASAVTARSGGRCVVCGGPGSEAHHILDRRLFDDGGYYLSNGALVCNPCHFRCETTEISVEEVRNAAGILSPKVPDGFEGVIADKWGNRILPSGLREEGPLSGDIGCRRALAKGGFLGLLVPAGAV